MKNYLLSYKTCYFLHRAYRQSYIVLRERKPHREVDTLPLRKRIPHKFNAKERSPLTQKFQYKPLYIKLQPNTKYIITHEGMGARVNIIKYYHTDSLGKLHPDD